MAGVIASLIVRLSANISEFEKGIGQAERAFAKTGRKLESIGKDMTKGLTLPLVAAGTVAVKAALEIDDSLDKIRVATGKTGEAFKGLESSFRKVAVEVPNSFDEVATAIADLNKLAGVTGTELEALATQQLNLAHITGAELKPQIEATSKAFEKWDVTTEKQGETLDFFFRVAQETGVSVTDLAKEVTNAGAVFQELGFSLEESAVLMGTLQKAGVDTGDVLSSMKKGLREFAEAGKTPAETFTRLVEAIKEGGSSAKTSELAFKLFGKSATEMKTAIQSGAFEVGALVDKLTASGDTINKAAKDTAGFSEQFKILQKAVKLALEPLGVEILNALESLMPLVLGTATALGGLARIFADLPNAVKFTVAGMLGLTAAIGPLTFGFGAVIKSFGSVLSGVRMVVGGFGDLLGWIGKVIPALRSLSGGFTALSAAMSGPVLAGFVVLGGALAALSFGLHTLLENLRKSAKGFDLFHIKLLDMIPAIQQHRLLWITIQAVLAKVTGATETTAKGFDEVADAAAQAGKQISGQAVIGQLTALVRGYQELTPAQRQSAETTKRFGEQLLALERAGAPLPPWLKAFADAARAAEPPVDSGTKKTDEFAKAIKALREQLAGTDLLQKFQQWAIVVKEIGGAQRLTAGETATYTSAIFDLLEKFRALGPAASKAWKDAAASATAALSLIEAQVTPVIAGINNIIASLGRLDFALTEVQSTAGIPFNQFGILGGAGATGRGVGAAPTAGTFDIESLLGKPEALPSLGKLPKELFKGLGDAIKTGLGPVLIQAFAGGGQAAKAGGGFLGGAIGSSLVDSTGKFMSKTLGPTLGKIFGSVIPGLGTVLGGLAGSLFGKLFGPSQAKQTKEMRDKFVESAGGLEELKKKADAAGFSLDKMLSSRKTKEFESEVKKLNEAIAETEKRMEGLKIAVEGVNRKAELFAAPFRKLLTERAKLAEDIKLGRLSTEELSAAEIRLEEIKAGLTGLATHGQAEFNRLGNYAAATFAGMVQETGNAISAIQALAPTFTVLQQGIEHFGLAGTATINNLVNMFRIVTSEATGPLFESIAALDQILTGFMQGGILTGAIFQDVGADIGSIFRDLQAQGVDMSTALALSQPTLQKLWEASQKFGTVTDETTAAILRQAEEQGLVGAHMEDVNERILDVLVLIADVLGADIPDALRGLGPVARDAARDIENTLGAIEIPPIDIPVTFSSRGIAAQGEGGGINIPAFQHGGVVRRPTIASVGEVPEAIIPLSRLEEVFGGATQASAGPVNVYVAVDPQSQRVRVLSEDERRQVQNWMFSGRLQVPQRATTARSR